MLLNPDARCCRVHDTATFQSNPHPFTVKNTNTKALMRSSTAFGSWLREPYRARHSWGINWSDQNSLLKRSITECLKAAQARRLWGDFFFLLIQSSIQRLHPCFLLLRTALVHFTKQCYELYQWPTVVKNKIEINCYRSSEFHIFRYSSVCYKQ